MAQIPTHAIHDEAVTTAKIADDAVTTAKVVDAAITVDKLSSALLSYLLPVGRIDYSGIDYCKIG